MTVRRLLCIASAAALLAGCGFGLYDDDGRAYPGLYWPWVCPDAGDASADGGCPHACAEADAGPDAHAPSHAEGGC